MRNSRADIVSRQALFEYLDRETLVSVESDDRSTVYTYFCGCVAVQPIELIECYVSWCTTHRHAGGEVEITGSG